MRENQILQKSGAGWCHIKIGNFNGSASYINDVPMDFLSAFKTYIDAEATPVILCDEEGSEFTIVVEEYYTHIIVKREDVSLVTVEIDRKDFIDTVLKDIENELEWFSIEFSSESEDANEILQRKIDMLTIIQYIRKGIGVF